MKLWLLAILIVGIAINNLSFAKPIKETGKFSVYIDSNPGYINNKLSNDTMDTH